MNTTIGYKILSLLLESRFKYRGLSVSAIGFPGFDTYEVQSIYRSLSRLVKKEYIIKEGKNWKLTKEGELYAHSVMTKGFNHSLTEKQPKNLILMFDIPESRKKERDSLRRYLKNFHYIMIQKSVWVGPSPLPKEFMNYLRKVRLKDSVKTFKLAKGYTIK
jgi:DNA-binding transcriptional regulator PaaX